MILVEVEDVNLKQRWVSKTVEDGTKKRRSRQGEFLLGMTLAWAIGERVHIGRATGCRVDQDRGSRVEDLTC